jgi:hypothetical protein
MDSTVRLALGLTLASALVACSVSVSGSSVKDTKFREVWSSGWLAVDTVAKPLAPSARNPGVCDEGGSQAECVATGQAMIGALSSLLAKLAAVQTPALYGRASATIQSAIKLDIEALTDRDTAIERDDDALFTKAITELGAAATAFGRGYADFPESTKPTPRPFAGTLAG